MHYLTDAFGAIGMFATLLIQGGPPWAGHDGGAFWGPWMLIPFLFWGGLLILIAWVVVRVFPRRSEDDRLEAPRDSAEEILRERFARGDISAEEYERALEILRRGMAQRTHEEDSGRESGKPED
jgi:putative membrane protein